MINLDRSKTDTPFALDLLRVGAAQMVCIGHALAFANREGTNLPLPQNVGVLLFFVLSGFLITHTLIERSKSPDYGFCRFFVDRFARIYSGLIPSLIIVAAIDGIVISRTGNVDISRYYTIPHFIVNALLFNDYRGTFDNQDWAQWSAFGSDSPMWTLAIEWHIYLFVAAIFFLGRRPIAMFYLVPLAIIFGQVPSHYIFGALQSNGVGQSLFLLWLGGAGVSIIVDRVAIRQWISIALLVAAGLGYIWMASARHEYQPSSYPFIIATVALIVLATQQLKIVRSERLIKAVRFAANYSFTLYLTHYTILTAFFVVRPGSSWIHVVAPIIAANLIAALVAMPTEMNHRKLADMITKISHRLTRKLLA